MSRRAASAGVGAITIGHVRLDTPWVQTASGRAVDLLIPRPSDIDLAADVAPALAKICRFGGQVVSGPYSVAQHCVLGAEAVLEETGRADLAAAFLLHDAHEAYLGDMVTPVRRAIMAEVARRTVGNGDEAAAMVAEAIDALKDRFDFAVYVAAGLQPPRLLPAADRAVIAGMDLRMLDAERRQLLAPCRRDWGLGDVRPVRLRGAIRPWPWPEAADRWLAALRRLWPAALER